jgi:flagellar L-ring protein precursor FlgH
MDLPRALSDSRRYVANAKRRIPTLQLISDIAMVTFVALLFMSIVSGCSHIEPRVAIAEPTTAKPVADTVKVANNGAIFQAQGAHRPLFEDMRPRYIGDILTINIAENTSASRTSKSTAGKTGAVTLAVPTVKGLPGKSFQGASLDASSSNTFEGKGDAANTNAFTGTITVTVVSVLPNGNLMVSGEKQIGINQNAEFIRFSGVVAPMTIQAGNNVQSTQVADARIEYRGKGYIDEAQRMGWLQRFFLNFLPF